MIKQQDRYYVISCHVLWRELCYYASQMPSVFNFHFLEQGLHDTPNVLRKQVQHAIDTLEGDYTAILLGYGLCSNGLAGVAARQIPLVLMRGHDCMTFFLGSRQRYQEYFDQHPGTYWYTPGWIETGKWPMPGNDRLEMQLATYTEKYGPDNAAYLMEMEQTWIHEYSRATYVDFGIHKAEQYRAYTKQCAQELGWEYDELTGDPGLIAQFLAGEWDSEDFLLVEPGQQIIATYDDRILGVESLPSCQGSNR